MREYQKEKLYELEQIVEKHRLALKILMEKLNITEEDLEAEGKKEFKEHMDNWKKIHDNS